MSPWPVLFSLCLLSACASAPTRYYSLVPVQEADGTQGPAAVDHQAAPPQESAVRGLRLDVIEVPVQNDRLQLVVQDPRRDPASEVQVLNESLWVSALDSQLQAILSSRVSASLGLVDLHTLPMVSSRPARRIEVRLTRFDMVWGEFSRLSAVWVDQAPGDQPALVCQADIQVAAGASVAELVQSQRQASAVLADLIIGSIRGLTTDLQKIPQVSKFGCA